MNTNTAILAQQVQRLLISPSDKQRLLDELWQLSKDECEELAQLIQQHDEEALEVLNQKSMEVQQVKDRLQQALPEGGTELSDDEVQEIATQLKEAFKNPQQLAQVIAACDDVMLRKLEELVLAGVEHDPEVLQECKDFFKEVRLQRQAFIQEEEQTQKKALVELVTEQKEQLDHMDALIKKSEQILGKKYQI